VGNEDGTTKNKQIDLTPEKVICGRHGEMFAANWPNGYPVFAALAFECLLFQETFQTEVRGLCGSGGVDEIDAAEALLGTKPVCCRLPKDDLLAIYLEVHKKSGVFEPAVCALCGKRGPGAPYRKVPPGSPLSDAADARSHVCVRCVCFAKTQPVRRAWPKHRIGLN